MVCGCVGVGVCVGGGGGGDVFVSRETQQCIVKLPDL